jgi:hypothetical protein
MRHSRRWLLFAVICVSCGTTTPAPPPPPAELPGGFRFRERVEVPAESVRDKDAESAYAFRYDGPAPLTVTVYRMKSEGSAFELMQKSRPQPGALYFHAGARFVWVEAPGVGQQQLNAVAKALEENLR